MINKTWIKYLRELKIRVLWSLSVFLVLFIIAFYFHKDLFAYIALPLLHNLPFDGKMIVTTVTAPFIVPIQLSCLVALIFGLPFYSYQFWSFVGPALYQHERKNVIFLVCSSLFLFFLGLLFAYFIFLPLTFKFLLTMTPNNVQVMTDISAYLDFVVKFLFTFGFSFQIPIIMLLLIQSNIISIQTLIRKRPIVIIVAFVIGMFLTPPDVISQILLAFPLWGLFELGIIVAKMRVYAQSKSRLS